MKVYKVVPVEQLIVIKKRDKEFQAIDSYYEFLERESVDGWEFVSSSSVKIYKKIRRLKRKEFVYNTYIFCKEVEDEKPYKFDSSVSPDEQ